MKSFARTSVLVLLSVLLGACSDVTGIGGDSILGTYTLTTVGGRSLPAISYQYDDYKSEVVSQRLVLEATGFRMESSFRTTRNGQVSISSENTVGKWEQVSNEIHFSSVNDTDWGKGFIGKNTITLPDNESGDRVYKK